MPDSPSSININHSTTHAPPNFGPKMAAEECLQRLEQELAANQAANTEINNTLRAIMSKLSDKPAYRDTEFSDPKDDPTPRARAPNVTCPPPLVQSTTSRVRPASPSDFDGDREKGRAFLNSCSIYFAICSGHFPNDQGRIHWALSFFKSDRAAWFANKILLTERTGRQ